MLKIMSAIYHITDVTISQQEAVRLYVTFMELLKIKIIHKQVKPYIERQKEAEGIEDEEASCHEFRSVIRKNQFYDLDYIWKDQY
jgi:N-dimethylarginine dimethylaminohydrolase